MEEQRQPEVRTLSQSMLREIAPVLMLGVGITGGVLWSLATGWALTSAPPYLLVQSLLLLLAFYLATRGAPRWSYPWLAFGIVAVQALLRALIPASDADITARNRGAKTLAGIGMMVSYEEATDTNREEIARRMRLFGDFQSGKKSASAATVRLNCGGRLVERPHQP